MFNLYTHSYLGYGADQARSTVNKYLVANMGSSGSPDTLVDPCLNPGYLKEKTKKNEDVYSGPTGDFHVVGGGDRKAQLCHDVVEKVLFPQRNGAKVTGCAHETEHTSFNCIYQPAMVRQSKNVLIFENFFYAASGMGTLPAGHAPLVDMDAPRKVDFPLKTSPKEFLDSAEEVCGQPWDNVQRSLPRDTSPKDSNPRWCFAASYAYLFLTHGIGFDDNKVVTVQQNIDGSDIEWVLGAAYREAVGTLGKNYLRVA
jgi:Golgi nucleoside diphosphatase